jgi:hypothetical protein
MNTDNEIQDQEQKLAADGRRRNQRQRPIDFRTPALVPLVFNVVLDLIGVHRRLICS